MVSLFEGSGCGLAICPFIFQQATWCFSLNILTSLEKLLTLKTTVT